MVICIVMVMNLELNNITVKESNLSKAKRNHVICIPEPVPGGGGGLPYGTDGDARRKF